MFELGTVAAMNLLGGMIPGSIQRDEHGIVNAAKGLQNPLFTQRVIKAVIDRVEHLGGNRVEHLAHLIITGNLIDLKEALGVVLAPSLLHGLLMSQEGGRLGEENGEG